MLIALRSLQGGIQIVVQTHLLLLRHDIDQGNDAPNPAVLIEQRFLDDLQEFLFSFVLLNNIGGALPGADKLQVGVQRPLTAISATANTMYRACLKISFALIRI